MKNSKKQIITISQPNEKHLWERTNTAVLENEDNLEGLMGWQHHTIIDELAKLKTILSDAQRELQTSLASVKQLTKTLQEHKKQIRQLEVDKVELLCRHLQYEHIDYFSDDLALVQREGKYGFIDKLGNEIVALKYDDALPFSENLAAVEQNEKFGFIDTTGKVVIDFLFNDAASFSAGLAKVENNGKYGFIDKTGKIAIDLQYDYVFNFSDGVAKVKKDDLYFYINQKGEFVKEA